MSAIRIYPPVALIALGLALGIVQGCTKPPTAILPTPAVVVASPTLFKDVTEEAGIHYKWVIPGKRPLNILQTIGNGCALLDYNNDGNLDVLLVGSRLALYQGDGKGHFTDVTRKTGLSQLSGNFLGCAVGDYDNDGYDDIYLMAYHGGMLLHNEVGKGFQDVTRAAGISPQPWATSATFVDVDGDGKLDLFIGNYARFGPNTDPQLCKNNGLPSACGPRFYTAERCFLFHNDGAGKFHDASSQWLLDNKYHNITAGKALGVAAADFEGTGRQSIAIANDEVAGDLLENQGHTFENIGAKSGSAYDSTGNVHGGMGIDWGDYDNDGKLDLVVATFQHENKCLYHNTDGFFTEKSALVGLGEKTAPYVAFGVKFCDYDNDGFLDLVFANGHVQDNIADIDKGATYKQKLQLFHNVQGSTFEDVSEQAGAAFQKPIMGRGLAVGDFDNDGRVDVLAVDGEGSPLLLHNEVPSPGHWLLCQLQGTKSNRDGIGALVTAEIGSKHLLRHCATDGSYMSASDRRVHFGLGSATVATITVHWPSGSTSVYKDIRADKVVTLHEGETTAR